MIQHEYFLEFMETWIPTLIFREVFFDRHLNFKDIFTGANIKLPFLFVYDEFEKKRCELLALARYSYVVTCSTNIKNPKS